MSATDQSDLESSLPASPVHTSTPLEYAITHVFLPVQLPDYDDYTLENDLSIARAVCATAHAYSTHVDGTSEQAPWHRITKMLDNLEASIQSEQLDSAHCTISQLRGMQTGDTLAFFMQHQNFAVIFTRQENSTLCESFKVSQDSDVVKGTAGSFLYSYPSSAVEMPHEVFDDGDFLSELVNFLSCVVATGSDDDSDLSPPPSAGSQALFTILRGIDYTSGVLRITKHVRNHDQRHWSRSRLWLFIRVATRMSLDRSRLGLASYKRFILFFMCTLAKPEGANDANISNDLLHLMSCKILFRLKKLGTSTLDWLSQMVLKTCACLRETLDARLMKLNPRPSPFQNPSEDELARDTQLSLLDSRKYIRDALANSDNKPTHDGNNPFHSNFRHRTIEDFLSSNGTCFKKTDRVDEEVVLYDVEQSIEQGIDDWFAGVTDVEKASAQLEILMDKYMSKAEKSMWRTRNPEAVSICFLTAIELFVVLDKLVVKEIPMLADYSPEIPVELLEGLLLRKTTSLHRLSRAYQYLSGRQSRSRRGWSALSDEFTEVSFPVRYYDQSLDHQSLQTRINEEAMKNSSGHVGLQQVSHWLLPLSLVHTKVVVFELQCPACFRIWRSAIPRVLAAFTDSLVNVQRELEREGPRNGNEKRWFLDVQYTEPNLLAHAPRLSSYFIKRKGSNLSAEIHFVYHTSPREQSQNSPTLGYMFGRRLYGTRWYRWHKADTPLPMLSYGHDLPGMRYVASTSHTSNGVLAAQARCPDNLSLDEFIVSGHLRSGGSLQWLNILQGLRSRTLNLRRIEVHFLLAQAALQVGPLDVNTGMWIWHQELQDTAFCNALLDELESLFVDIGAGLIDDVLMNTISLLLTRVLASTPSEAVSERAIKILRRVRKETFKWVEELQYNLILAPRNKERSRLLLEMAVTCRSTYNVDTAILHKLCHSAEDVDALLSCALFVHTLGKSTFSYPLKSDSEKERQRYSDFLVEQDHRLSFQVEGILRDVILADPSDRGVDLAVAKIPAAYRPSAHKWKQLQSPDTRWLTCKTEAIMDQPSQVVHVNLLDGELRVDGELVGGLLREVNQVLLDDCDEGLFAKVSESNPPGMCFMTRAMTSRNKFHLSLSQRDDDLVVRAQCRQTGDILELIPPDKLQNDLPSVLVEGHLHWLNLSTKTIAIRPNEQPWEESSENWRIDCTSEQYRAYKGRETLVDVRSPTWEMVSKCFEGFNSTEMMFKNSSNELLITVSSTDSLDCLPARQRLSITLTSSGLSFFVNEMQEVESCDFKHMVYDEDQYIGALFGLEKILVLRHKTHITGAPIPDALMHRLVLIPDGLPKKQDDHRIQIVRNAYSFIQGAFADISSDRVLYHTYNVDTELGCLTQIGNGNLASMQYLAVLHAMTNSYRPDPLTGKTGPQASLCFLHSAGCRSIMKLKPARFLVDDLDILQGIYKQYPQIGAACEGIYRRYYWDYSKDQNDFLRFSDFATALQRATYLFPCWNSTTLQENSRYHIYPSSKDITTRFTMKPPASLPLPCGPAPSLRCENDDQRTPWPITLEYLLSTRRPPELSSRSMLLRDSSTKSSDNIPELSRLFTSLPTNQSGPSYQRQYIALLENSAQRAREGSRMIHRLMGTDQIHELEEHYTQCRSNYLSSLGTLKKTLGPTADPFEEVLNHCGQWPAITADNLLQCLASSSPVKIPSDWKEYLISLALLLLDLQRARRLLRSALDGLEEEFSKELENNVCDGWNAEDNPDWLLIQVQGNFLIRRSQAEIAMQMISPKSGENTVMQVNMGEGKSSVIIPITAAVLADGNQLVRVIVPKSLTVQMFESLVTRLGGLANRPIFHLPFSRSPEYDDRGNVISLQINDLHNLMSQCMAERGVVLVQPEHIVSLKLMGVEQQIPKKNLATNSLLQLQKPIYKQIMIAVSLTSLPQDSFVGNIYGWLRQFPGRLIKNDTTRSGHRNMYNSEVDSDSDCSEADTTLNYESMWLEFQNWIHSNARDILDESDEILHPRFQLIYTMGLQKHMDGYPHRWTITQQVLQLVKEHIHTLSSNHPNSVEYAYDSPPGTFPGIRIVQASDVGRPIIDLIVEDIMAGRLPDFNFQDLPSELQEPIRDFISDPDISRFPDTVKRVEDYAKGDHQNHLWSGLLLLRGLLACNILLFALAERRWRIDYGLDLRERHSQRSRTPTLLAVPYRAKDMPAPDTQFGHPDITILLTCLSYYYHGLTEEQLRVSFQFLLDEDSPSTEYALWIKEFDPNSLSDSLRDFRGINLNSSEQWDKVTFPRFSRNQATIDFYLSRNVFPREAKEFPCKFSASGWDLAEKREKIITGFSGTNDSRWLLPMSIAQRDLDQQKGTNARVLAYLLRPENDAYMVVQKGGERWSTLAFLRILNAQQPEIRVLLDVGAQVLDFSNGELAKEWLNVSRDASGAIYLNENDELSILTRDGTTLPLSSSPLSQRLDRCVVYLDHAHTRGTDLQLPIGSRAAVTLGPKLTKDSLVQGCMRMRKLGRGHSVMFFAPLEVDRSIRVVATNTNPNARITTVDIICWTIHETWTDIQQRAPYWAQQGMSHKSRSEAWIRFCKGELAPEQVADAWLQPESKSLANLYAPSETKNATSSLSELDDRIRLRCNTLGVLSLPSAQIEEEQEREVNREREREREVELPPEARPAKHFLHEDVVKFVKTGDIDLLHVRGAFRPIFTTLGRTTAVTVTQEADVWSPLILATVDFCQTIKPESTEGTIDQYLRPVQWILTRSKTDGRSPALVLLSPFEANALLPDIRVSKYVHLHLYAPRTSRRMTPSDDLKLYSIPPLPSDWTPPWDRIDLIDQLNIFAGQLYLRDYMSYLRLCQFLGIPISEEGPSIQFNLFDIPGSLEETEIRFSGSPLPSVMALLAMRSRGRPFADTHMGKILRGQPLTEKDF